ncbi:hypothetical protein EX30DRAFT_388322 [Ascodesmis nigricans]|uniref:Uncharacterized protein n=1 Tax=Ascodesmis nigricans TaxID=341454 RepID=A0A4S2MZH7_9PEZI|nr:hypothetical protein EX30DRAFT_388322 [Ascodesmis nigricans]
MGNRLSSNNTDPEFLKKFYPEITDLQTKIILLYGELEAQEVRAKQFRDEVESTLENVKKKDDEDLKGKGGGKKDDDDADADNDNDEEDGEEKQKDREDENRDNEQSKPEKRTRVSNWEFGKGDNDNSSKQFCCAWCWIYCVALIAVIWVHDPIWSSCIASVCLAAFVFYFYEARMEPVPPDIVDVC